MPLFLAGLSIPVIAAIAAGCGVGVALIGLLSWILVSRRRLKKKPAELREIFDTYYTQLTSSCKQSVDRLGYLGQYSAEYKEKYEIRARQYDKILNERGKDVKDSLDSRNSLLVNKDRRTLKSNLPDFIKGVNDFQAAVSKFSLELSSLLQDENDTFSWQVDVQEKNRKVREFYENNKEALAPLSDSFNVIFKEADSDFKKFNTLVTQTKYADAKNSLTDIRSALSRLIEIEDQLPLLTASLYTVLPEKTNQLLKKNDERIADGFVISYRKVPEKVKEIRLEIQELCNRLQQLDVSGIDRKIQTISKQITDREAQFKNEEKAKEEFLSGQDILSSSSYQLEKRFSHSRHRLPEYQKAYCIDEKYIKDRNGLKGVIENINLLKNRLDSYTGTGRKESYTVIVRVRREMRSGREKAEKTRNNYDAYIKSVQEKSQETFCSVRTTYLSLKKGERTIRNRNVSSVTSLYQPRFEKLEKRAKDRTDLFSVFPIDLNKIRERNQKYQNDSASLLAEISKKYDQRRLAEAAIVKGNFYRQDFTDSNVGLDKAVNGFSEGDFERALTEATNVIKRRKTDSPVSASH